MIFATKRVAFSHLIQVFDHILEEGREYPVNGRST